MPELLSIGISHKTAQLALREKLALAPGQARELTHALLGTETIHECVALSTCNRTELYLFCSDAVTAEAGALARLSELAQIAPTELSRSLYTDKGTEVASRLMRVAGGLDSMVVGESEILGQLKRAHEFALEEATAGPVTNRLFGAAITAGKRVQSETAIGAGRVSVATTAVGLAAQSLGELVGREALVIGSGAHGESTARALTAAGVKAVFIANRHYDRAIGLAGAIGGRAVRFEHLPEELAGVDIVLGATGSPHTLIHADELREVMQARQGRELLMIDTAVPRDIESAVAAIPGVTLLDMDDLQSRVESTMRVRRSEAAAAESVIAQEVDRFETWLGALDVLPTIAALQQRGRSVAQQVVAENASRFESLSAADRERLLVMAEAIATRLLHEPTMQLRSAGDQQSGYIKIEVARELFALGEASEHSTSGRRAAHEDSGGDVHSLDKRRARKRA